jgi:hypothetical protein
MQAARGRKKYDCEESREMNGPVSLEFSPAGKEFAQFIKKPV